jgi:hypothetical protein
MIIVAAYHFRMEGRNPLYWTMRASEDLRNPLEVNRIDGHRRGTLQLPREDVFFCRENLMEFWDWIVIWVK